MAPLGRKIPSTWRQVGVSCPLLGSSWRLLGRSWCAFRRQPATKLPTRRPRTPSRPQQTLILMIFDSLGGPGERLGGYVGRCWLQLGRLWLILRRCWGMLGEMHAKIVPRGAKMSPRGAKIRQLDAKLKESCGQEAPRSSQGAHFGVMLTASWSIWKAFVGHLEQKAGKQKPFKKLKFLQVFHSLGGPDERLGSYFGRC